MSYYEVVQGFGEVTSHRAPAYYPSPTETSPMVVGYDQPKTQVDQQLRERIVQADAEQACIAQGGTYNPRTGTCSNAPREALVPQESPIAACKAQGGTWNQRSQMCDMGPYKPAGGGGAVAAGGVGTAAAVGAGALALLLLVR